MLINKDPLSVRSEINLFREKIYSLIPHENDASKNLLISMFKHAVFYNVLTLLNESISHKNYIKGMTYDALNCIICLIQRRERSLHLNLRSIIEHSARIALNKSHVDNDFDGTVRRKNFDYLKQNKPNENWKYMHESYSRACQYIHSSPDANLNISATFTELLESDFTSKMPKQILSTQRIISEITKILITYLESDISNSFLRTQKELEFLLGKPTFAYYLKLKNQRLTEW
ncbi:TPA: hypothetical protein ACKRES_001093 [Proteus mirabilis]|uniref:hypothetical protein n=1 Tax=Proteus TaxID=583 RepID=UPI00038440BC|nr:MULTISPECIES: hypothetical protein [Proteus]ELA9921133.1 hypothetical protein [Proteus mirabilis]AGS59379.1 hypothetical protein BB2000_0884 [Proteus mirabilis BB2000]ELN5385004.1 hypothetical protein [Proteus mirabilis]MBG2812765.1 hypothetical protein [Proteus mirabilis]MBG6043887.1 hypothetical protein [Proteus mirabilis]